MTKNKSQSFRLQIRGALDQNGWDVVKFEEESQWFAKEHWTLKSARQAYGHEIILSFMIDPMDDTETEILSVEAREKKPVVEPFSGNIAELYMPKGHFAEKLSAFMIALNTHRCQQHNKGAA